MFLTYTHAKGCLVLMSPFLYLVKFYIMWFNYCTTRKKLFSKGTKIPDVMESTIDSKDLSPKRRQIFPKKVSLSQLIYTYSNPYAASAVYVLCLKMTLSAYDAFRAETFCICAIFQLGTRQFCSKSSATSPVSTKSTWRLYARWDAIILE